jgi:MauM/NapG family ferredoxin protein
MLRRVRIISQITFITLFAVFFFLFGFLAKDANNTPLAIFLRLNPFSVLVTSIASKSVYVPYLIPALIVFILTILFGRFFCGLVCPLGAMVDFFDRLVRDRERRREERRAAQRRAAVKKDDKRKVLERRGIERRGRKKIREPLSPLLTLQKLKYIFLTALVVLAILGVTFPLFMDPLCLIPRIFGILVYPAFMAILNVFKIGGDAVAKAPIIVKGAYSGAVTVFILLVIIIAGSIFDRRFWCQYICPTGAFLGIFSRFTIFTRKIDDEKCNECHICADRYCPTRAIFGEKGEKTSAAECILCGKCTADKRFCNSFGFHAPLLPVTTGADLNRRHVATGIFAGLMLTPVFARMSRRQRRKNISPVRPPGAVMEDIFLDRCITCGACISVCPEIALHPSTLADDGMVSWNTPKLVPRIGYCAEDCVDCSHACPTGALIPIKVEDKTERKIGIAVVDRSRCFPWLQERKCMICVKKCPYEDAITDEIVEFEGREWSVPVVNKRKCVGCGECEFYCPVRHESAIQVFSQGEKRIKVASKKKRPKKKE